MQYIGIDMSKISFHAALDEKNVQVFKNNSEGIKIFLETVIDLGCAKENTIIGTEATGVYHFLFCEILRDLGWQIKVINPLLSHKVIDSTLRRVKTDHHDAIAIRKAVLLNMGYIYTDTPEILALKTLVVEREALARMRAETKQRIHNHSIREKATGMSLHDSFSGTIKMFSYEIREIEKKMKEYVPTTQKLLQTIPGVGPVSTAALVANIGDIKRFSSPEKLVAYIGLDCRVHESGTSVKGKGYMTKRGNRYLRYILFNAAFIAKRRNPILKKYFEKKVREGKHYFSAVCAVERKLVHIIYAVWSRGTPFENR
jgi:transposase